MDTYRPEVQSPVAALGPLPSLPSQTFHSPTQSLPALLKLSLSPSSALIPQLRLVKGVTHPSQEGSGRHKEPKCLTSHHAVRPQNLVSTQACCQLTAAALTVSPLNTTSTHGGGWGGSRDRGSLENSEADGVGNTEGAQALSTQGSCYSSPVRGTTGKHTQSDR